MWASELSSAPACAETYSRYLPDTYCQFRTSGERHQKPVSQQRNMIRTASLSTYGYVSLHRACLMHWPPLRLLWSMCSWCVCTQTNVGHTRNCTGMWTLHQGTGRVHIPMVYVDNQLQHTLSSAPFSVPPRSPASTCWPRCCLPSSRPVGRPEVPLHLAWVGGARLAWVEHMWHGQQ
jgi:hypothetical protein